MPRDHRDTERTAVPFLTGRRTAVVVVLGLVVLLSAWAGFRALSGRSHLLEAQAHAQALRSAMAKGDAQASAAALADVQSSVLSARKALNDPVLKLASHAPVIGANVMGPRVVAHVLYDVSQGPLPKLTTLAADMSPAKIMSGGKVNLAALEAAAPGLAAAAPQMEDARRRMHNIDTGFVLPPVAAGVAQVTEAIDGAADAVSTGARIADLGPTMLDGHKKYLLVFQNNAEVRTTGGMPGAWAELDADNGQITLGKQGTANEIPQFPKPVLPLTKDEEFVYSDKLATWFADFTFTPDFPRGAEIAAQMIKDHNGLDVDGVVSVDPVAMSYLLRGTGPVKPRIGDTLTTDNVVPTVLNGAYLKYDGIEQDAYFAAATVAVFNALTGPNINAEELGKALAKAAGERRLLLWSKDESVQRKLSGTAVAGEAPSGESDRPQLGFYMNDVRGSKMEYYLAYDAQVEATKCTEDGAQTFHAVLTYTSTAPANAADLPPAITGGTDRAPGLKAGEITLALDFFAPYQGEVLSVVTRGEVKTRGIVSFAPTRWKDRAVGQSTITLEPGQTKTLDVVLQSGKGARDDADVLVTPGVTPNKPSRFEVESAC